MRILINDHAGHPFQVELSRSLADVSDARLVVISEGLDVYVLKTAPSSGRAFGKPGRPYRAG